MSTLNLVEGKVQAERTTRLLNIGRIWLNEQKGETSPVMSGRIDRDLGASITLSPNDRIVFFSNTKRDGKKDADFRVAIELPAGVVDQVIETQRSVRGSAQETVKS